MSNSRLVYSTDDGDRRRRDEKPKQQPSAPQLPNDGVVRVFREKVAKKLRAAGYQVKLAGG